MRRLRKGRRPLQLTAAVRWQRRPGRAPCPQRQRRHFFSAPREATCAFVEGRRSYLLRPLDARAHGFPWNSSAPQDGTARHPFGGRRARRGTWRCGAGAAQGTLSCWGALAARPPQCQLSCACAWRTQAQQAGPSPTHSAVTVMHGIWHGGARLCPLACLFLLGVALTSHFSPPERPGRHPSARCGSSEPLTDVGP